MTRSRHHLRNPHTYNHDRHRFEGPPAGQPPPSIDAKRQVEAANMGAHFDALSEDYDRRHPDSDACELALVRHSASPQGHGVRAGLHSDSSTVPVPMLPPHPAPPYRAPSTPSGDKKKNTHNPDRSRVQPGYRDRVTRWF